MELSIQNLAKPRKQQVTRKTASYTSQDTSHSLTRINGNLTIVPPVTPSMVVQYYARLYEGAPPSGYTPAGTFAYAEIYTNNNSNIAVRGASVAKGRICYIVEPDGGTAGTYNTVKIHGIVYDNDTMTTIKDFWINPAYYLLRGHYCVGIRFKYWRCDNADGSTIIYNDGDTYAPKRRETRSNGFNVYECAAATGAFSMTIEVDDYDLARDEIDVTTRNGVDSDSSMGYGGLTSYAVCIGVDYKDKNAAAQDPSGHWLMDSIDRKTQNLYVSWS